MAYYTAFIDAWNAGGIPLGGTGTPINDGMTAEEKRVALNGWIVPGPTNQAVVPTYQIYNAIDQDEFSAISQLLQNRVQVILGMGNVDISPGTKAAETLGDAFASTPVTLAAIIAIQDGFKTTAPWWNVAGYLREFDSGDVEAAGVK